MSHDPIGRLERLADDADRTKHYAGVVRTAVQRNSQHHRERVLRLGVGRHPLLAADSGRHNGQTEVSAAPRFRSVK